LEYESEESKWLQRRAKEGRSCRGFFSLRCERTGKYVCAGNEGHVTANRSEQRDWELFKFDGTKDTWGRILCNRDSKYWYTKKDGAIHHKDHVGQYLFVPCTMSITNGVFKPVATLQNATTVMGKQTFTLKVGFSSTVAQTTSLKVAAGFIIEKVFKEDIEMTHSMTTSKTHSKEEAITIEVPVPPGKQVVILQETADAQAGFSYLTGHYRLQEQPLC